MWILLSLTKKIRQITDTCTLLSKDTTFIFGRNINHVKLWKYEKFWRGRDIPSPPQGGSFFKKNEHFSKKMNIFQKVAICVFAKNNIKNAWK